MAIKPPYGVAAIDSASSMLVATAWALKGLDFPALGNPKFLQHLVRFSEILPTALRRAVYGLATGVESIPQRSITRVRASELAEWATSLYPEQSYPAVIIGSSSGALVHLAAALNAPWLPQTFLIAVRRKSAGIDDPRGDLAQARASGEALLANNPELQLHHMHDPNQDRLSLQHMTYFRPKIHRLPAAYRRFLLERVRPGGVVLVADCTLRWPTTKVARRYFFQFGAVGGMPPDEYFAGGERVADLLARHGAGTRSWHPPEPDGESPEAEWGFESSVVEEIEEIARKRDLRVMRLRFADPEDLSPLVADFYRDWYRRLGLPDNRLLIESFILMEPHWTFRTGSVPFWMTFNTQTSLDAVRAYLDWKDPYDEIRLMLFSHGTVSIGLPSIEDWRTVLDRARQHGSFVGVTEQAFPHHFSALARYHLDLRKLPAPYPLPDPVPFEAFEAFCASAGDRYPATLVG